MLEVDVVSKTIRVLNKYFYVYPEITSKCGKGRIDAIIVCKNTGVEFGVEFKQIGRKRGNELGELIKQAHRYSMYEFPINDYYKRIPIFIAPPISYDVLICPEEKIVVGKKEYFRDRHPKDCSHHTMNGILGSLGIGELRKRNKKHFYFSFSNKVIWTNDYDFYSKLVHGLHEKNYNDLILKINQW